MTKRIYFLVAVSLFLGLFTASARAADSFVVVKGHRFYVGARPYYYVGTNYWYGSLLGLERDAQKGAERLRRELDFLKAHGVNNLRLLAGAEGAGLINGVVRVGPPLQPRPGEFDERVLESLDLVLAEMGKRGMKAVVFFSNNWEWSGGFQQYLTWNGLVPDDLKTRKLTWDEQRDVVSQFYGCEPCKQGYARQMNLVLDRVNKYTGKKYTEDPAVMAWELANEPRPMRPHAADAYRRWITETAAAIKAKDRNHLVTIGHEGYMGTDDMKLFEEVHAGPHVDYLTIHIWPKNWSWFKGHEIAEGFADVFSKTSAYIEEHLRVAERLGKPLVVEEFGLPRDGHSFDPTAPTSLRDALYGRVFSFLEREAAAGGHLAGANFWAFGGEARPVKGQTFWKEGDSYMGDPPMEEQGLNTVFDSDRGTWALISAVTKSIEAGRARPARSPSGAEQFPPPVVFKGDGDHRHMMEQLGIKRLRPGADPNDPATFDEARANPYPLPELLVTKSGRRVTTPAEWRARRAELLEEFEREVYGRVPPGVPAVRWVVTNTSRTEVGGRPVVTKTLVGRVDNSSYPLVNVNLRASLTTPADAAGPAPVMVELDWGLRRGAGPLPWQEMLIKRGWGYASIVPVSIQPDGPQLTSGIIGLTNKGQPRRPEDWGALRAWAWGVSRLLDYFETDKAVDARQVGVEGLSRYGKAALVAMAFEPRLAVALIGSSGEGGAKPHRRLFGERVENLTGGLYYWMAGNFLKYGADEAASGPKTAADLPVDAHQLIALCAPRPCFISYGVPEKGDAHWVDARGSFMATVAAGPAYRLLGKRDLGVAGDYLTATMPPVGQLIGGELAWRQHGGGHSVAENWPAFIEWAGQFIKPRGDSPRRRRGR